MNDYLALSLGMLCAGAGGELLLRGSLGLARWLGLSLAITRCTVSVFATAAAEMLVVIQAARIGRPDLAIGAALGTSVVNLGLVLAVAWLTTDLNERIDASRRQIALSAAAPLALLTFARNGMVSRTEGSILFALFVTWLVLNVLTAKGQLSGVADEEAVAERRGWLAISFSFVGLLLLITAGRLIVHGIEGLALHFQSNFFVLGATLAPLCTTVPELTHSIVTQYRGGEHVSTNSLLDNSLLNSWCLAGLAAWLAPARLPFQPLALTIAAIAALTLLVWPASAIPGRIRGLALLAVYGTFIVQML